MNANTQRYLKKEFPWVVYDEATNTMHCTVCRKFPSFADGDTIEPFIMVTMYTVFILNVCMV